MIRALLLLIVSSVASAQGYQPSSLLAPPRAPVVACLGASQASGYNAGYGYCQELGAKALPAAYGGTLGFINLSYAGANAAQIYGTEWQATSPTGNGAGITAAVMGPPRFVVFLGDGAVNNAYSGSPASALPPMTYIGMMEACLAAGCTVFYVVPNHTGDEDGTGGSGTWTAAIQNYLGAVNDALLSWCVARRAGGAHIFCEDFSNLTGALTTVANAVDVNFLGSVGPVSITINGTTVSYSATLGGDAATATAVAGLLNGLGAPPNGCASLSASVVASTYVEITCTGATAFVPILTSGVGPSANATAFGTCVGTNASCNPKMQAGYISSTKGHPSKSAADLGADVLLQDIRTTLSRGW